MTPQEAVEAVKALHSQRPFDLSKDSVYFGQTTYPDKCDHCRVPWPCATIKAIEPDAVAPSPKTAHELPGGWHCYNCGNDTIVGAPGGGIVCKHPGCGYWYCS